MDLAERELRFAIMTKLREHADKHGGLVTREYLETFTIGTRSIRLIDQSRGIRNPRDFSCTLSIISDPLSKYADKEHDNGLIDYAYETTSTGAGANTKLRLAMAFKAPLILFRKIAPSLYLPVMPVYVTNDDTIGQFFQIAIDDSLLEMPTSGEVSGIEKEYAQRIVNQRLHQPEFRARVLKAYEIRCAVCRLNHSELLDAAHIIPDSEAAGVAHVTNGLSLCKIHHGAYDNDFMGIKPDYSIVINHELLVEVDGPMLKHGLQEMHGRKIVVPGAKAERPSQDALAARFERFRAS